MSDDAWRGTVGKMAGDEVAAFLEEPIFARLATLDDEGWPYVVPCWQEWRDGRFWVVARKKSAWAAHLNRDPRCALTVDEDGGQRKVVAQCRATLEEEPGGRRWVPIGERMASRYLGENGPKYLVPTLDEPRWLFSLEPVVMKTWQGNDWHEKYKTT
jgi:nitroimidazol reductase NimA-like FMN-containing flavoprotein (pyridoxamine 5'-phosphate oxidase superfamily)